MPKALKKKTVPSKHFILENGIRLKNILELANALEEMPDKVYNHHTTGKNDFKTWIEQVFQEKQIAKAIEGKNKKEARIELYKALLKRLW